MKKLLKSLLILLAVVIVAALCYLIYVFASYYRIEDNQPVTVEIVEVANPLPEKVECDTSYLVVSANVGFGAYSDDYSFFMDGGTQSWAFSEEECFNNIDGSVYSIIERNPDFVFMQEVDKDATRSYHIDQMTQSVTRFCDKGLTDICHTFAQNYDSPFLMWPLNQPHGKSKAGLLTISKYQITQSIRRSLPIETGLSKLIDLDRCYCKNYIDVENGKQLVLYNCHLSAYTTDPSTAENQVKMLNADMAEEYAKGNYIIVGGDMNKDLLGDSSQIFKKGGNSANWASPFPEELLDEQFSIVAPFNEANPIPTCRNADAPYSEDTFVLTIDGFIVSDNVTVEEADVIDNSFKYSDHNPVYMTFKLN